MTALAIIVSLIVERRVLLVEQGLTRKVINVWWEMG